MILTKKILGFSVVEIIVVIAIITTVVTSVTAALQFYLKLSGNSNESTVAALLIEEAAEAMILLRDLGWDENIEPLDLDTTYYLYWNGTSYQTTLVPTQVNGGFYQTFQLTSIERNQSDNITQSGTPDPNTLLVELAAKLAPENTELLNSEMLIHNSYAN